jgi:hypothetical protein
MGTDNKSPSEKESIHLGGEVEEIGVAGEVFESVLSV